MPTCGLMKNSRQNDVVPALNEQKELRQSRQNSRQAQVHPAVQTPNARYNEKLVMKKVAPAVGLPPIDQKHLNLRRGGE